jgi:outer membrane protein assembly factor BamB
VHQYKVLAIDRATGKTAWERVAREEEPHEASHQDNGTWASSSAVTDGTHLFAVPD